MGFRGSNASCGRLVLLPGAFWAHGASKMATLGTSRLPCILQYFRAEEGMLPLGACRTSRASARRIVSCRGLSFPPSAPKSHMRPLPHLGVSDEANLDVTSDVVLSCCCCPSAGADLRS